MDGQLMGEFEAEVKDLEADSWSLGVEPQYLQQLDKELVKRQDVIYGVLNLVILKITHKTGNIVLPQLLSW